MLSSLAWVTLILRFLIVQEILPTPEGLYPTLKSSVKYIIADEEQLSQLDMPAEQVHRSSNLC